MIKYRAKYNEIKAFEIIKETEKQIVYPSEYSGRETREAKMSDWASWHNTFEEAMDFLIKKEEFKIAQCNSQIDYHKERIESIRKLTNN